MKNEEAQKDVEEVIEAKTITEEEAKKLLELVNLQNEETYEEEKGKVKTLIKF